MAKDKYQAIFLIGPTGSGKTPLGNLLQSRGLYNKRYFHFDFGAELRNISSDKTENNIFNCKEIDFIKAVLNKGVLLEKETFYIAEKILRLFIKQNHIKANDIIILNGLPRHIKQAKDINSALSVTEVFFLHCPPEIVYERIKNNTGGDRAGRIDDGIKSVKNKVSVFMKRTAPLIKYYRNNKVPITRIDITADTTAEQILQNIL